MISLPGISGFQTLTCRNVELHPCRPLYALLATISEFVIANFRLGARLCGNGLEIVVLGDSAPGASALES